MKPTVEPKMIRRRAQKGFVMIMMATAAIAVLGALGLAVDMGRIFIVKNETQAFCDSAAMTAASYLDGTSQGVQAADTAAKATAIKWNFSTTTVASPTVEYATSASGPWSNATAFPTPPSKTGCADANASNNDPACNYRFARVKTSVQVSLYFLPVVQTTKTYNQTVNAYAIAGQVNVTSGSPVSPYTGVADGCYTITAPNANGTGNGCPNGSTSVSPPFFGLTPGNDTTPCINGTTNGANAAVGCYDIQWPHFNGSSAQCKPSKLDSCFISPPCANDQGNTIAEAQVVNEWASSSNGYWGLQAASAVGGEVIDYTPNPNMPSVGAGSNIYSVLTNGQQQSQSNYLDERVNQDPDNYDTLYSDYLAQLHANPPTANGRRLMLAPIVYPDTTTNTAVQGFGLYFLLSNSTGAGVASDYYKKQTNGNSPYCALYVGPTCIGCKSTAAGGSGDSALKLVQ